MSTEKPRKIARFESKITHERAEELFRFLVDRGYSVTVRQEGATFIIEGDISESVDEQCERDEVIREIQRVKRLVVSLGDSPKSLHSHLTSWANAQSLPPADNT